MLKYQGNIQILFLEEHAESTEASQYSQFFFTLTSQVWSNTSFTYFCHGTDDDSAQVLLLSVVVIIFLNFAVLC